nr:pleiotropic drug resistance protein 1 [Quercus suber]
MLVSYKEELSFLLLQADFNTGTDYNIQWRSLEFRGQRDFLCHSSWVYALPLRILKITFTFVEVGAWVILAYYVNGFDPMLEAASMVVAKRFGSLTNLLLSHRWLHPIKR